MSTTLDALFGPIGKKYCLYFWALSVFGFAMIVITVLGVVLTTVKTRKLDWKVVGVSLYSVLMFAVVYLQNRLLFNMCSNSI